MSASEPRAPRDVARRCLCLELLFQRYVLELDDDDVREREAARQAWAGRAPDLGVSDVLLSDERALLERPVGGLSEDDLDDVHGRASGALVLLWALGRLPARPGFAAVEAMDEELAAHGLLGDGSVSAARAAAEGAALRPEAELDQALSSYLHVRGKAREVRDPEKVFADVAAHHLTWVLDASMAFDADVEIG